MWCCLCDPLFSCFSRTPTCDRQTDRHGHRHRPMASTRDSSFLMLKISAKFDRGALRGHQMQVGWVKIGDFLKKPAISQKWCKIDTWFLLKSNRKSYALYRMVTLSMTLSAPIVPSAACPVPISATCSCPVDGAAHLVNASENSQFGRFSPLANVV